MVLFSVVVFFWGVVVVVFVLFLFVFCVYEDGETWWLRRWL